MPNPIAQHLVFVDGQDGTTGLRIHELLAARPDIEVLRIAAERRKDVAERSRLLNAADIAFLCLPDAAAREAAALVTNPATCLIDASTAHRTRPDWVYGLPELGPGQRDRIRASKRIANPGCHATALILLVRPLIDAGVLSADARLSATSISGYSGGGKTLIAQYQAGGEALLAPRPYGLGLAHKHVPEMMVHGGLRQAPVFTPIVGPFYQGLAVMLPLHFADARPGTDGPALQRAYEQHYEGERFIRVLPLSDPATLAAGHLDIQACNGTNRCDILVFADTEKAVLVARLDNLGKGASGAAIQAMNIHLGLDEGLGL
jgi:N-acetyl-gamma-glutamyl-phosphate reductase